MRLLMMLCAKAPLIELKSPVSLSISTAASRKGIPIPREYTRSKSTPLHIPPDAAAVVMALPKNTPTQGVWVIEKTIPNKKAEKTPFILIWVCFPWIDGSFITPKKLNPKNIIIIPQIIGIRLSSLSITKNSFLFYYSRIKGKNQVFMGRGEERVRLKKKSSFSDLPFRGLGIEFFLSFILCGN